MKRMFPLAVSILGLFLVVLMVPAFTTSQPKNVRVSRAEARRVADVEARKLGIDVTGSWVITTWETVDDLMRELEDPRRHRLAEMDAVVGPRLQYYRVNYFRNGRAKNFPAGVVLVAADGRVVGARRRDLPEEAGANPSPDQLRAVADQFALGKSLPGAPDPRFDSIRPTVLQSRTDTNVRYRVATTVPLGDVACFIDVHFVGDRFSGWTLIEERQRGTRQGPGFGAEIIGTFFRYGLIMVMLFSLLAIFLKKYHAGEVGVRTGALLFVVVIALSLLISLAMMAEMSLGMGFGDVDAQRTAYATAGFKLLFYDIPLAVLVFLSWSVGESFARERWGERLASFDAILRRDLLNATVGRSVLSGVLCAPAVAAASYALPWLALKAGFAHTEVGGSTGLVLGSRGGVFSVLSHSALESIVIPVVALLFLLALFHSRRLTRVGILVAAVAAAGMGALGTPIGPPWFETGLSVGGAFALIGVFLGVDLLASSVALLGATLLTGLAPLIAVTWPNGVYGPGLAVAIPVGLLFAFGLAGVMTKRHIVYTYSSLAPHVKRIIERERVKAEIDAANRIQAALLPDSAPDVAGALFVSHYRSATEIGGDYFDFLPLKDGNIGLAFGDVAGHGLTSGIVMAMAKAALLVQVDHDPSPTRVMNVLNDIVMKTAPRRMLMTFFFGILDSENHSLRFSSAGHLDPYVYRAREKKLETLSAWGFPLGVRRRDPFRELQAQFEPGDRLILYSDGLIEAVDDDGAPFGFSRFEAVLQQKGALSAEEIKKEILQSVRRFTSNRPPEDDQTLVVISFEQLGEAELSRSA